MGEVTVLNPVGRPSREAFSLAPRLETLKGQRIGLIDNMKPGAGPFLQRIGELLKAKYPDVELISVRKPLTSNMPIAWQLDGRVDAAINAWGD